MPSPEPTDEAELGPFVLSDEGVALKTDGSKVPLSLDTIGLIVPMLIHRLGFFFWFPVYLALLVITLL